MPTRDALDRVYDFVAGEEDERSCEAIPESACENVPESFLLNAASGALTKLADQLASPGLVLAWILSAIGAPAFWAGLLVPVREAGAMAPQLVIAGRIRAYATRKWFWVAAAIIQSASLGLIAISVWTLPPAAAGAAVVGFLLVFSIARGVASISFKDVVAKTIPKRRRGRLLAIRATAGGILAVAAGAALRFLGDENDIDILLALVCLAAALWLSAAGFFGAIPEQKGATDGGRNAIKEAAAGWRILRQNRGLVLFITARSLLALGVALATPYFALLAYNRTDGAAANLALLLIASSLAGVLSSPVWGWMADLSSRRVIMLAALVGAAASAAALALAFIETGPWTAALFALAFVVLGLAQAGLRLGRKTYLVDGAPEKDRPTYVAVANTIIGLVTIAGGALGFLAQGVSVTAVVALLLALTLAGVAAAWAMPEAEDLAPHNAAH